MSLATAEFIVDAVTGYLACGTVFAVLFVWRWVGYADPAAVQGTRGFRILIAPGVAMVWPMFVMRLLRRAYEPPDEWTAHRAAIRRGRTSKGVVLK